MKNSVILILIFIFSLTVAAQKPKTVKKPAVSAPKIIKPAVDAGDEKEALTRAVALTNAAERITALQKFVENFPNSGDKTRAQELIVSARAEIGDEKLRLNEIAEGVEFFKLAVKDAPQPMSDKIFNELILNFPTNLFWHGERREALEIARLIEAKADKNAPQLIGLASFYLGTENASEAKRLAEKALALDAGLRQGYQTLGLSYRLNFQLEESANAYAKALELDPNSSVSKRSLAEMKRAVGKPDEAAALYREILEKDAADISARTGLVLALFGAEKRTEAEAEMSRTFEANPNNLALLVGAAYWYAVHNESARAVEMAQKAVLIEPRYTWAHIALAHGFLRQNRPLDAERTLLTARQYGNFPTLDYEIAAARMQAGFFREAVEILKPNFTVSGDIIKTNLGGRVAKEAANFTELLALERRASIFETAAADDAESSQKLKALLALSEKLSSSSEAEIASAADEFVKGEDKMNVHRTLFTANLLMQNKKALPKALELAQAAVGKTDPALDAPNAAAAVLADELYESRTTSISRNQFVIVPNVPRQTLSAILRGRIEEITGWTFYQQNNLAKAALHLKRAVSVLPDKSAWWRSSMWRLGAALEADGKEKDALDSYIKSYPADAPDGLKYILIESLYKKINGSSEGLEAKIGAKPASAITASNESEKSEKPAAAAAPNAEATDQTTPPNTETLTENSANSPATSPATEIKTEIMPENSSETKIAAAAENPPPTVEIPQPLTEIPQPLEEENKPENQIPPTPENLPVSETNSKTEPAAQKPSAANAPVVKTSEKPKSFFEPIIITIPKAEKVKTPNPKTADINQSSASEDEKNSPAEAAADALTRPRVIEENPACALSVSQENVSLINGGGSLGILVGFEKSEMFDYKEIKAVSGSPKDVEIMLEPEVGELSGRAFFVIKSISSKVGEYTVTFEASCGKKDVSVKVR